MEDKATDLVDTEPLEASIDVEAAAPAGTPCEACGAPVDVTDKFCSACGCPRDVGGPAHAKAELSVQQKLLRCENCGSEVATSRDQRSYVCAFCDSTYVIEFSREAGRHDPEYVIGFAVTGEQARQRFRNWISQNSWFRPGDLHKSRIADKLRGVYLPFWSFSMLAESKWSASIGEYWYRKERYTTRNSKGKRVTRTRRVRETEWWPLAGGHHHYYSGYMVSGSRGLSQQDADRIKPFNLPALQPYEPWYLAGWLCEEYSINKDDALETSKTVFYERERANVAAFLPGDTHRALYVDTRFSNVNSDLCLLPIYILSYRYKDKLYRFLVNGQTGKVAGDKPVSRLRIGVAIGAALLLLLILVLVFVLLSSGI